jgi:hypothetical protein
MRAHFRHAAIALAAFVYTLPADAQSVIVREPAEAVVEVDPIELTPVERRIIYRRIVRERTVAAPIVRERIVRERVIPPAPVMRERIVRAPEYDYDHYDRDYSVGVREPVGPQPSYGYNYRVGAPVPAATELYSVPPRIGAQVPAIRNYRYTVVDNRVLLVDPTTNVVVDEIYE